jgi:hypothetical protein
MLGAGYGVVQGDWELWPNLDPAIQLDENDYVIRSVKETMKDSASEVQVVVDSGMNIADSDSFDATTTPAVNGANMDFPLSYVPTEITDVTWNGIVKDSSTYRVDTDNKTVKFNTAPIVSEAPVIIKYTRPDLTVGVSRDMTIQRDLGGMRRKEVKRDGRMSQSDANALATSLLRTKYHVVEVKMTNGASWAQTWYIGKKIQINNSNDYEGINGNYKVRRVRWEGSIDAPPKLLLEETDEQFNHVIDVNDIIFMQARRNQRATRYYEYG